MRSLALIAVVASFMGSGENQCTRLCGLAGRPLRVEAVTGEVFEGTFTPTPAEGSTSGCGCTGQMVDQTLTLN